VAQLAYSPMEDPAALKLPVSFTDKGQYGDGGSAGSSATGALLTSTGGTVGTANMALTSPHPSIPRAVNQKTYTGYAEPSTGFHFSRASSCMVPVAMAPVTTSAPALPEHYRRTAKQLPEVTWAGAGLGEPLDSNFFTGRCQRKPRWCSRRIRTDSNFNPKRSWNVGCPRHRHHRLRSNDPVRALVIPNPLR